VTCPVCGRSQAPDIAQCECGYAFKPPPSRATTPDRCPQCGRTPPPHTPRCDYCGYRFTRFAPLSPRREAHPREGTAAGPQTGIPWLYQLCVVLILLWSALCAIGACYGIVNVSSSPSPSDPWARAGHDLGVTIGLGLWAIIWVIPTVGLGVIGLLVKPR
jgi:hypothetical protein